MADELMTAQEVATRLRVSRETVRRWLRDGKLKGFVVSDAAGWRIPVSEVDRFIDERLSCKRDQD